MSRLLKGTRVDRGSLLVSASGGFLVWLTGHLQELGKIIQSPRISISINIDQYRSYIQIATLYLMNLTQPACAGVKGSPTIDISPLQGMKHLSVTIADRQGNTSHSSYIPCNMQVLRERLAIYSLLAPLLVVLLSPSLLGYLSPSGWHRNVASHTQPRTACNMEESCQEKLVVDACRH
jgi:hypothetical protein